jgi:hypothetical protein
MEVSAEFYQLVNGDSKWLANRTRRVGNNDLKYNWARNRAHAATLSYDQAQKARQNYGGQIVRVTQIDEEVGAAYA